MSQAVYRPREPQNSSYYQCVQDHFEGFERVYKGYKLLQGFRGRPKGDIETIEKCLVRLSNLAMNHPKIVELDINPLLVHPTGQDATAADCRMILRAHRGDPQLRH
jgi:hypothetical protein